MTEIGEKITLNLEFEVVESEIGCEGCIGRYNYTICNMLPDCSSSKRPDNKHVIFKLIENDPTAENNH